MYPDYNKVFQDGAPLFYPYLERMYDMTINEASERYKIPIKILQEYESWGLCGEVKKLWVRGIMMKAILND